MWNVTLTYVDDTKETLTGLHFGSITFYTAGSNRLRSVVTFPQLQSAICSKPERPVMPDLLIHNRYDTHAIMPDYDLPTMSMILKFSSGKEQVITADQLGATIEMYKVPSSDIRPLPLLKRIDIEEMLSTK